MVLKTILLAGLSLLISSTVWGDSGCGETGVWLQVLGSGGPEMDDGRASSGYVIWRNGRAKLLVDMGSGSMFRFEQSGASLNDLDVIMFTHLHVDHSNDLPALIKASFFSDRNRELPLFGPSGNRFMPALTDYLDSLFGLEGAFRYLNRYLDGPEIYLMQPKDVDATSKKPQTVLDNDKYKLTAVGVHHGPLPALAWRVELEGKILVFSGDMNNENQTLAVLAKEADILVAHHAIPEGLTGVARNLHMPPSVIGEIAAQAKVKQVVLSHFMKRTLGQEENSSNQIRKHYQGPLKFAQDLQCFSPSVTVK